MNTVVEKPKLTRFTDDSIFIECTSGIHFFITKQEAMEFTLLK